MPRTSTIEHDRRADARARLVVLAGPQAGLRCELSDRSEIGRAVDSAIVLEDTGVSRKHAVIVKRGDGVWEIEDLGSRNGVRVNGITVKRSDLFVGDKIQLGPSSLLLFTDRGGVEQALVERQKFELLGRVSAGIAHDFNNALGTLGAATGYLRTIGTDTPWDPVEVASCLEDMAAAVAHGARLASRLVGFVGGSHRGRSMVDVSALCHEIAEMCRRTFGTAIRVELEIQPGLRVLGDEGELEQVLMNLCVNARDAMLPAGGTLTIRACERLPIKLTHHRLALSGPHLVLSVEDTGAGIEARFLPRIFETFFTTKGPGTGSGLGLATVKELVTLHGGAIDVESEPRQGSTFKVYLPVAQGPTLSRKIPTGEKLPQRRVGIGKSALIADPDGLARRSTGRLLAQTGFSVIEARDGRDALALYATSEKKPDIVVIELEMAELDGLETLRELRADYPDAKVLVLSGLREPFKEQAIRSEGAGFLGKPYDAADLIETVQLVISDKVLDESEMTTEDD